jgi:phosphopantetheinyl transferase
MSGQWLTAEEHDFVASIRLSQRREEWMASRIAAREAAARLFRAAPGEIKLTTSDGRPAMEISGVPYCVSYSHTHGVGAAAVDRYPIGVDLERIRDVHPRMAKFFLSPAETEQLLESDLAHPLIQAWSAKEAAFKMFGTATLLSEISIGLELVAKSGAFFWCRLGQSRGQVITSMEEGNFVLAVSRIVSPGDTVAAC